MPKRLIIPLLALAAVGGLAAVALTRPPISSVPVERRPRAERVQEAQPTAPQPITHRGADAATARAVGPSELPALDEARVRESLRNLRVAVASGNETVKKVLVTALDKDRAAAERIAREELSRAASGAERDLARKTLEALGRTP